MWPHASPLSNQKEDLEKKWAMEQFISIRSVRVDQATSLTNPRKRPSQKNIRRKPNDKLRRAVSGPTTAAARKQICGVVAETKETQIRGYDRGNQKMSHSTKLIKRTTSGGEVANNDRRQTSKAIGQIREEEREKE